ncbi:nucleoid occlusion factor SlmA [Paraburkholderia hayleyella]|uniref:nucleoid occlusion factor SlmA n=1 Tax=Paraburkholderia hayleyella TaxID=2152889 RepID=UPI001290FFA5|nr:nucleoid occlusion factor SlmA [Paraburkholderia hayleyella]
MSPPRQPNAAVATANASSPSSAAGGIRGKRPKPGERRVQILQTLAAMLEAPGNEKITTAALAAQLGVSEAALYRHFASKAQMFEGLIEFIEQTIFGLINQITTNETSGVLQARTIARMLLDFAEKNPGMTRVLTCEALVGEHARLSARVNQLLLRVEASLKQCLRLERLALDEAPTARVGDAMPATKEVPLPAHYNAALRANLLLSYILGRWHRYARSGFARLPAEQADAQIRLILQ